MLHKPNILLHRNSLFSCLRCKILFIYFFLFFFTTIRICFLLEFFARFGVGRDPVVSSSGGVAELCLHVLSGHVERWLHLCRAFPLEVSIKNHKIPDSSNTSKARNDAAMLLCSAGRCLKATPRCSSCKKSLSEYKRLPGVISPHCPK